MGQLEPPLGRLVEVDGRRLMVHRTGSGGPAVVFLPGSGLIGADFLNIHDRVAEFTTSVLYDRGGTGWSDPVELPRSPTEVTDELRSVLRAAGVPAPYVLAGHSLGAFYARRYAQRFPVEVAGILLLDPGHEDILDFMPVELRALAEQMKTDTKDLPDLTVEQVDAARGQYAQLYSAWPDSIREALIEEHLGHWRTQLSETENFETDVYDELRVGGELPDVPLIAVSAQGANPFWANYLTDEQMREALDGVRAMHEAIAASVPRGEHREVEGASHQYLHIEHPDVVVQVIRDLFARVARES